MVWWYQPLEILDKDGQPSGRYRMVKTSDEGGGQYPLCQCEGGHAAREEAYECYEAHKLAQELMNSE